MTSDAPAPTACFCSGCLGLLGPDQATCTTCAASRPASGWPRDRRIGHLLAGGQYRAVRRLGSGGFGTVYLVESVVGGLRRALKVLHTEWACNAAMRDRFVHEAIVLEQIHHPNVARCHGVGVLDDDADLYLAIEYVEGPSLARAMSEGQGALEPLRAVRIARQVAAGLAAAHAVDVLHRDLKPENVLLAQAATSDEQAKIIDFGIAKSLGRTAVGTSMVMGTPEYLAPEQLSLATHDARLDLWQLGAVLFCMLTGRAPYAGVTDAAGLSAAFARDRDAGPRPSAVVPSLRAHQGLDDLVSRLLAADPGRRPPTAGVACKELARVEHQLAPAPAANPLALLEALCATPGPDAWWALCRYVLDQPAAAQRELVDAADGLIAHWPDELRLAPASWWDDASAGRPPVLWRLARALDLSGRSLDDRDALLIAETDALASITRLTLADNAISPAGARRLAGARALGGLVALDLSHNRLASDGVAALAAAPFLTRLDALDVSDNGVGPAGAEALARTPWRLRRLGLGHNGIGAAGVTSLAASPALRHVESLDLSDNGLGSDGIAALATARELTSLTELDLSGNDVGAGGAAALTMSPALGGLHVLRMGRNRLGAAGTELLGSLRVPSLDVLDLSGNELGATGAMMLAASATVRRLKCLDVSDNQLGDAGLAALLGAPGLRGLRELAVARNGLTAAGLTLLGTAPLELTGIDVSGNTLGDEGGAAFGAALARTRIGRLGVAATGLSGAGLAALVHAAGGRLTDLDASSNDLGPDGPAAVAELDAARHLVSLRLAACRIAPDGLERMAAAHHLSRLQRLDLGANALGDASGARVCRALERVPAVWGLDLADNALGSTFAHALAASTLPARLHALGLRHNALADDDVAALSRSSWPLLRRLDLAGNPISQAGAATLGAAPALPLLATLALQHTLVRGGTDLHSLSRPTVACLESSFAHIAARGADFASRFYDTLFARHPAVRPLFARVSMRHQQQHLLAALTLVIDHLRTPDAVAPALEALGRRHVGYHVQASHYVALTHVALDVIRETLGDDWSPDIDEAWHRGLDAVCGVMLGAHRSVLADERRAGVA
ncbi:MAG: protein kinase [Vicinamibacterales bacterium]